MNPDHSSEAVAEPPILVDRRGRVGLLRLNRPSRFNALSDALIDRLGDELEAMDADDGIGAIVITGSDKAFAAGADIGAMADWDFVHVYKTNYVSRNWDRLARIRKPVIAAETARFGQPEVRLGVLPGAGGTQRLPRAVGKAKAMDLCLTARMMDAQEAERAGLVSRIVPAERLLDEALEAAARIAAFSLPVAMMIKESVNRAFESGLSEGLLFERRSFHAAFGLQDQKEGMAAFLARRNASFSHC
ncbi:enoyl-CoA hydratase-related protein [Aromatoleum aromaticum]|uniref:enoyl-CoA hydratase-related protein n=1 Tax=Aromatoleum aromaticum TaxID=551760 RepID=UPI001459E24A|nr:enoyl-CoA hydratase-related protein [Aromatoleum aromaticum]NMG55904.1 enoyl-CoA hydratase [Aromatoleum aromaticum]